jgi:hypothetical protein
MSDYRQGCGLAIGIFKFLQNLSTNDFSSNVNSHSVVHYSTH